MVEFALVLPLLLVVIFISIAVALSWGARIQMQKMAYDAARNVAKHHFREYGGDCSDPTKKTPLSSDPGSCSGDYQAMQVVIDQEWNSDNGKATWLLHAYTDGKPQGVAIGTYNGSTASPLAALTDGPDIGIPNYSISHQSVEVKIRYKLSGVPGWNYVASLYGGPGEFHIEEKGIATRVVDKY